MFSKQELRKIMQLWAQSEIDLRMVFDRMLAEYSENFTRQDSEWETLRQSIEFTAKKQVLVDLKNIFSKHYE